LRYECSTFAQVVARGWGAGLERGFLSGEDAGWLAKESGRSVRGRYYYTDGTAALCNSLRLWAASSTSLLGYCAKAKGPQGVLALPL
jgi:hypothetical protein